jgi:hypothetical protein
MCPFRAMERSSDRRIRPARGISTLQTSALVLPAGAQVAGSAGQRLELVESRAHRPNFLLTLLVRHIMDSTLLIILVVLLVLFGGGWGYSRRRR